MWDFGVEKIHDRVKEIINDVNNQKHHAYQLCEDLFEILVPISLYEPYRIKLANDQKVHNFLEETYSKLLSKRKTATQLLNVFMIYMSNLLSGGDSGFKNIYLTKQKVITLVDSMILVILDEKTHNRTYLELKKNVYGMIANLTTNSDHRKTLVEFFQKNNKFH